MRRALLVAAALLSSAGATSISEKLAEQPCLLRHHRDRDWALKVTQHQAGNHSQYGQDGALQWIYQHIGEKNRFFVEYGFDATNYGGGVGANTHNLYELGWRGVLFDGQYSNPAINLHQAFVTKEGVADLLRKHNVPPDVDLLSNDIDSADFWVLRAIFESGYRPRVILTEFNINYPIESTLVSKWDTAWHSPVYGGSYGAFAMLADEYGYVILDVIDVADILMVQRSLLCGSDFPSHFSFRERLHRPHNGKLGLSYAVPGSGLPGQRPLSALATDLIDYSMYRARDGKLDEAHAKVVMAQVEALNLFRDYPREALPMRG